MQRSLLASVLALFTVACQGTGQQINDHWNADSIAPRMARFFLGYDSSRDGDWRDFTWENKQSINLTLRRHFFHHNPDNPNHPDLPLRRRPKNSLLPDPVTFIHVEGILLGFAAMGAGGPFVPLPVGSLIGVFEEGGRDEFMEGISGVAGDTIGAVTATFVHKWIQPAVSGTVMGFHHLVD